MTRKGKVLAVFVAALLFLSFWVGLGWILFAPDRPISNLAQSNIEVRLKVAAAESFGLWTVSKTNDTGFFELANNATCKIDYNAKNNGVSKITLFVQQVSDEKKFDADITCAVLFAGNLIYHLNDVPTVKTTLLQQMTTNNEGILAGSEVAVNVSDPPVRLTAHFNKGLYTLSLVAKK